MKTISYFVTVEMPDDTPPENVAIAVAAPIPGSRQGHMMQLHVMKQCPMATEFATWMSHETCVAD